MTLYEPAGKHECFLSPSNRQTDSYFAEKFFKSGQAFDKDFITSFL